MDYLLEQYGQDARITTLLDNRRAWFIPMLNPDGHIRVENGLDWRKNMRDNQGGSFGVDLNRNYSYMWGCDNYGSSPSSWSETYRGPSPVSEPETRAIRSFREDENYRVSLSFHSYGNVIFYPWAYSDGFTDDQKRYSRLASVISAQSGYNCGNTSILSFYPANGEFDDWNYAGLGEENKAFGLTFEVGDSFYEPDERIESLCGENLESCIAAICAAGPWLELTQYKIEEDEPDGIIRADETFFIDLRLQSFFVDETGPTTVRVISDSPLISIANPEIFVDFILPLSSVGPEVLSFEMQAILGEAFEEIVPIGIEVQTEGFLRRFELFVPVGLEMNEGLIEWDLEEQAGWQNSGLWQLGMPTGRGGSMNGNPGPAAACSGQNVFGTNLQGDVYGPADRSFLLSPEFSCEGFTCTRLSFMSWLNIGVPENYRASVDIYVNGRWHGVWLSLEEHTDSEWKVNSFDISRWADDCANLRLRFSLLANGVAPYSGWYIDDVAITGCRALSAGDTEQKVLPFVLSSPDRRWDTIIIAQNRTEQSKHLSMRYQCDDGRDASSSEIIQPFGLSTFFASDAMGSGLGSATLEMAALSDLNISAFLVDLDSLQLSSIDLLPQETESVDLHLYYSDINECSESFLVLSNHSEPEAAMSISVSGFDPNGDEFGSFDVSLAPLGVRTIDLRESFGANLGWLRVEGEEGLSAAGLLSFSQGAHLQMMKAFPR